MSMAMATHSVLILGTRSFAIDLADVISEIPGYRVTAFVENLDPRRCDSPLAGLPVLWVEEIPAFVSGHVAVCGLSTTNRWRFTEQVAAMGMKFGTFIHPSAQISVNSTLSEGCVLNRGAIVAGYTHIGRHVLVSRGATIGHHTTIGNYCTIQPGANVAGSCAVGERVYIGMSATVIDKLTIGNQVVIGAGAVVVDDVPPRVQVLGLPARVVKREIDGL